MWVWSGWFQSRGAELLATRTAWLYARMLTLDVQDRPTAEALTFYRRAGLSEADLAKRASERPFNFADVVDPMPLGFTRLTEGQRLRVGGPGLDRSASATAMHPTMRRFGPMTASFWAVTSFCPAFPPISASIRRNPTPTR